MQVYIDVIHEQLAAFNKAAEMVRKDYEEYMVEPSEEDLKGWPEDQPKPERILPVEYRREVQEKLMGLGEEKTEVELDPFNMKDLEELDLGIGDLSAVFFLLKEGL